MRPQSSDGARQTVIWERPASTAAACAAWAFSSALGSCFSSSVSGLGPAAPLMILSDSLNAQVCLQAGHSQVKALWLLTLRRM